jgi:hypothetical protein
MEPLLALGTGTGSELRRPLGIAIIGGLIVSQMLTLYTTPVVFLYPGAQVGTRKSTFVTLARKLLSRASIPRRLRNGRKRRPADYENPSQASIGERQVEFRKTREISFWRFLPEAECVWIATILDGYR